MVFRSSSGGGVFQMFTASVICLNIASLPKIPVTLIAKFGRTMFVSGMSPHGRLPFSALCRLLLLHPAGVHFLLFLLCIYISILCTSTRKYMYGTSYTAIPFPSVPAYHAHVPLTPLVFDWIGPLQFPFKGCSCRTAQQS